MVMKMILRIIKIIIGIFFILISIAGVVSLVEEGFEMLGFVLTIVFMFSGVVLNLSAFKNESIKESLQKNKVLNLSSRIILSCCIGLVFIGILLPGDKVDDMANDPASVDSSYESEFLSSNKNQDSEIDVGESQVLNDDSDDEEEKESENPQAYVVVSDTKKSYEDTETSKDISISIILNQLSLIMLAILIQESSINLPVLALRKYRLIIELSFHMMKL